MLLWLLRKRTLLKAYLANFSNGTSKNIGCSSDTQKPNHSLELLTYLRCRVMNFPDVLTCKDRDSQQNVHHKMHLSLSFCNNANPCNNPACSTTYMESHTFIYKRSFDNKVEHHMYLPGISLVSLVGWWRFHCWTVMATWGSTFSNITFALLAQKPLISPTHTLLLHLPPHTKPF